MGTKLFIVQRGKDGLFPLPDGRRVGTGDLPPGAMWRCSCHGELGWLIQLPDHAGPWCTLEEASGTNQRWEVTGEAPNLTVTPSIDASWGNPPNEHHWHGFITKGELI